jgi:hypothetical protein
MSKSFLVALIGLVVTLGSVRGPCWSQQPAKVKNHVDRTMLGYLRYLRAMKEPSLWHLADTNRTATVYRFFWVPAGTYLERMSVRVVKTDERVVLHAVRLRLDDEYEPVRIIEREKIDLKPAQWDRIAEHLAKAGFWTLPTRQREPFGGITLDAGTFIVEGVSDGRYHAVIRYSPLRGEFVDLCAAMLFSSRMDVRKLWSELSPRPWRSEKRTLASAQSRREG